MAIDRRQTQTAQVLERFDGKSPRLGEDDAAILAARAPVDQGLQGRDTIDAEAGLQLDLKHRASEYQIDRSSGHGAPNLIAIERHDDHAVVLQRTGKVISGRLPAVVGPFCSAIGEYSEA
jgi:hypothetical protein